MPSKEWMEKVLGQSAAAVEESEQARQEALDSVSTEPPPTPLPGRQAEEDAEEEAYDEADTDEEEVEEDGSEDLAADDEEEADGETEASAQDEDFYIGRYRTREEAERGLEEKERTTQLAMQRAAEAERVAGEAARRIAFLEGRDSTRQGGDFDFEQWADRHLETSPDQGMLEAIRFAGQTGDENWVWGYLDRWTEVAAENGDMIGVADARAWKLQLESTPRVREDTAQPEYSQQQDQNGGGLPPAEVQNRVMGEVYAELREEYPDLDDPGVLTEMGKTLKSDRHLNANVRSADPRLVAAAFLDARQRARTALRPGNGTPRRVRAKDAAELAAAKTAARSTSGEGATSRRSSTPEFPPEVAGMMAVFERQGQVKARPEFQGE